MSGLKEEDDSIIDIDDIIMLSKDSDKIRFIIVDKAEVLTSIDNYEWYNLFDPKNGILVSSDFDEQELFIAETDYNTANMTRDDAVVVKNTHKEYVKFVNVS